MRHDCFTSPLAPSRSCALAAVTVTASKKAEHFGHDMALGPLAIAACIGVFHLKWDERPIIAVVKKPDAEVTREELLKFYESKTAKWQIPDDAVFVEAIPIGATGKLLKTKLRELLKDYKLPEDRA